MLPVNTLIVTCQPLLFPCIVFQDVLELTKLFPLANIAVTLLRVAVEFSTNDAVVVLFSCQEIAHESIISYKRFKLATSHVITECNLWQWTCKLCYTLEASG